MEIKVDELNITNVSQEHIEFDTYFIDFKIDELEYYISTEAINGVYRADSIWHNKDFTCDFCDEIGQCTFLEAYKDDIFKRLITFPSIRLEWLFINHV